MPKSSVKTTRFAFAQLKGKEFVHWTDGTMRCCRRLCVCAAFVECRRCHRVASVAEKRIRPLQRKRKRGSGFCANIDIVVCVTSTKTPPFRPRFVDRVSVLAEQCGAPLLVVCNKVDLGLDGVVEKRLSVFESLGFRVLRSSVALDLGIDELREALVGKFQFLWANRAQANRAS